MTSFFLKLCGLLAIGALGFWWIGRGVWRARRAEREVAIALEAFPRDRHTLEKRLLDAAGHMDNPRGLIWKRCELLPSEPLLARDMASGKLYALVPIEVSFEKDDTIRSATAIFIWHDRQWLPEGRVAFDLDPQETLKRYSGSLVPI